MRFKKFMLPVAILLLAALACNLPTSIVTSTQAPNVPANPPVLVTVPTTAGDTAVPPAATNTPILHVIKPVDTTLGPVPFVYDVDSSGTAPERRAPYGDSYNIDRFERPFLQDMTYNNNLDILSFNLTKDETWYYVSIALVGSDPNDALGIDYGVEVDLNRDGFGDYLIWARPPYGEWSTSNVEVRADKNRDTAGLSADKSDAPIKGDGYETLVFDGNTGQGSANDPDLAWVRAGAGKYAAIQFAFKQSLIGSTFMMGVVADAGLKDPGKFDYNDRFTEAEAGSPIKDKQYYPLKALYAVDNTCWNAFGFNPTGDEPKLCPTNEPPPSIKEPKAPTPDYCTSIGKPNPGNCIYGWSGPPWCMCTPG